jgi:hypothetical protein
MNSSAARVAAHAFLYGHISFKDYIDFMSTQKSNGTTADYAADWRKSNDLMIALQESEAGWADRPAIEPLPETMQPFLNDVLCDPVFRRSFGVVPVDIGMVELDRLVVWQTLVNLPHVERLMERLGPQPGAAELFRFCLPYTHESIPPRMSQISDHSFAFVSESTDLRFLEAVLLEPHELGTYQPLGPLAGVVAIMVGYGSNYLNVLSIEDRLILNNGNHRAYALRAAGITRAPCVIQKLSRRDELNVLAAQAVRKRPDNYLKPRRPPTLKDFFDPTLCRRVAVTTNQRQVRVAYNVEEMNIP